MKAERLFYLDFIRAISILLIVIYHFDAALRFSFTGTLIENQLVGAFGVSLFLILSGASLMHVYQNDFSLKDFYSRRFLAIFPIFWVSYFIFFIYLHYIKSSAIPYINPWAFVLTIIGMDGYLSEIMPTYYILGEWFLGMIILFYIFFPIIRWCVISHPEIFVILSSIIFIFTVESYSYPFYIWRFPLTRLPEFLFGVYFIYYMKNVQLYKMLVVFCIYMAIFVTDKSGIYNAIIINLSVFIVLALLGNSIEFPKIRYPFILISKYSYSIFLVHHIVIYELAGHLAGKQVGFLEASCLFVGLCVVILVIAVFVYKLSHVMIKKYGRLK
jgi:peptidoglycan/LPS O-acetylase OafA/YrhL